jgi:hypothetical protein
VEAVRKGEACRTPLTRGSVDGSLDELRCCGTDFRGNAMGAGEESGESGVFSTSLAFLEAQRRAISALQ